MLILNLIIKNKIIFIKRKIPVLKRPILIVMIPVPIWKIIAPDACSGRAESRQTIGDGIGPRDDSSRQVDGSFRFEPAAMKPGQ